MSDNYIWFRGRKVPQEVVEEYWERKADEARDECYIEQFNAASSQVKVAEWQGMEGYKEVKE